MRKSIKIQKSKQQLKKEGDAKKLRYILDNEEIGNEQVAEAFGFPRTNMISNFRNGQNALRKIHKEGLEKHFKIPVTVFDTDIKTNHEIDMHIDEYRKNLKNNIELSHLSDEAKKTLEWLKGSWYSYSYGSQVNNKPNGIWIMKTTIHENLSVTDEHGNKGYLHIKKKESYIEKETKEIGDLILIRFPNNQIPYKIFRFSIQSNQTGTENSMFNYGFYSRKLYTPQEAKMILGDIKNLQLKLDLDFNARIVENYKY